MCFTCSIYYLYELLLLLLSYYYILFCLNFYYLHTYYTSEFRECMPIFLLLLYGPPSFTSLLADLHFILIRQISPPCSKCLVPTIILIIPQSSIYPYIKKIRFRLLQTLWILWKIEYERPYHSCIWVPPASYIPLTKQLWL